MTQQLTLILLGNFDEVGPQHCVVGMLQDALQALTATVKGETAGLTLTRHWVQQAPPAVGNTAGHHK